MEKFISKEEYLNALDIVEAYHKQLYLHKVVDNRKLVSDWLNEQKEPLPSRVIDALTCEYSLGHNSSEYRPFKYMDEINKRAFMRCRNVGKKAWDDFCKIYESN